MTKPLAYAPESGYKYQLLTRCAGQSSWEHCDYAHNKTEKNYLLREYRLAYGVDFSFQVILLPVKYWK